jgi:hypothetical protein
MFARSVAMHLQQNRSLAEYARIFAHGLMPPRHCPYGLPDDSTRVDRSGAEAVRRRGEDAHEDVKASHGSLSPRSGAGKAHTTGSALCQRAGG